MKNGWQTKTLGEVCELSRPPEGREAPSNERRRDALSIVRTNGRLWESIQTVADRDVSRSRSSEVAQLYILR